MTFFCTTKRVISKRESDIAFWMHPNELGTFIHSLVLIYFKTNHLFNANQSNHEDFRRKISSFQQILRIFKGRIAEVLKLGLLVNILFRKDIG